MAHFRYSALLKLINPNTPYCVMKKTFYITTAIDYPNGVPHQGHCYERIIADVAARYHRLKQEDVFFLTGTDENTQKVVESAQLEKIPVKAYVDSKVKRFQELLTTYHISNTDFIRTTESRHVKLSQQLFQKAFDKGDIYLDDYEGLYCVGCEAFYTEKDLLEGNLCPDHKKPVEKRKERAYFFKLSKYQKPLLKLLKSDFIQPKVRANELIARLENEPLHDLCVSREGATWGIPVPFDSKHSIYVWFDALINYLSGINYDPKKKKNNYWPCNVHVIGKGIAWFHAVIWPAMLLSIEIPLPKHLLVHGYINDDKGQKMSKSIGNVIDPFTVATQVPIESTRYYLMREVSLESDMNFSITEIKNRHNNELANELGNLLNRTLSLIEKNHEGRIPKGTVAPALKKSLQLKKIEKAMDHFESFVALEEIFSFIRSVNQFTSQNEPWKLPPGKKRDQVLYSMADSLRISSILLEPFIPDAAAQIREQLGLSPKAVWKDAAFNKLKAGTAVKKSGILFPKLV